MKSKILNAIQEGIKQSFMIDSESDDEKFVKSKISKTENFVPYEYRFVDLGLSVKWAEYNLGAYPGSTSKDWYGDYYAWGEIEPKSNFTWDNYKFKESLMKYNKKDKLKYLESEDDIATQKLGSMYKMPTSAEFEELCDTTKVANEWISDYKGIYGLNGMLFTSKVPGFKGNSIFIPAAVCFIGSECYYAGSYGLVWSSSLSYKLDSACQLYCYDRDVYFNYCNRCDGHSIRAVQDKK